MNATLTRCPFLAWVFQGPGSLGTHPGAPQGCAELHSLTPGKQPGSQPGDPGQLEWVSGTKSP